MGAPLWQSVEPVLLPRLHGNYRRVFLFFIIMRQSRSPRCKPRISISAEARFVARAVLVEDKANGSAVIQVLQSEMFCIPIQPLGGKVARVNAVSPAIESGHVYVPEGEPWVEEFLGQWTSFPAGAHDDMVDSGSQALRYLLRADGGERKETENEGCGLEDVFEVYE